MKKTLVEVRAELEGSTVEMLRTIVRKDSTIKGVSKMRKAELIEAAVKVVAQLNPEVVEQPAEVASTVREVLAQVEVAETKDAIVAILMTCTKTEMLRVLSESTNGTRTAKVSTKKCELVSQIARRIVEYRAERKFRELRLDEKYEYLTSQTDKHEVTQVFWCMSGTEFEEIARRLGIDAKGSYAVTKVQSKLMEITEANKAKSLAAAKDVEGLSDARTPTVMGYGLRELCAETGIEAEADRDVSPAEGLDAVSDAVRETETSEAQIERHDALSKCTDAEKLEVMNICTGCKGKLREGYDSEDAIAWKVLWEIAAPRRTLPKEVKLNEAV